MFSIRFATCILKNIAFFVTFLTSITSDHFQVVQMFRSVSSFALVAPLLLLTCDCGTGPLGGATAGFIPVPDGSEGTIHQWGIEGAQPKDKVSIQSVKHLVHLYRANFHLYSGRKRVVGYKKRDSLTLQGPL